MFVQLYQWTTELLLCVSGQTRVDVCVDDGACVVLGSVYYI